jgi:hypothetical protein
LPDCESVYGVNSIPVHISLRERFRLTSGRSVPMIHIE